MQADITESASAALRAIVVGKDAKGWEYFAFGKGTEDARLYRQLPSSAPKGKAPQRQNDEAEQDVPWEIASANVEVRKPLPAFLTGSGAELLACLAAFHFGLLFGTLQPLCGGSWAS